MEVNDILAQLRALAAPDAATQMARFGINAGAAYGVPVPQLRALAKAIGTNHTLAEQLWMSGIHEARILASMVDDPRLVTEEQLERWVAVFDSWDVCDQCCGNLFDRTPFAYRKALEWSTRDGEYVKRAGFALMAYLAVHDKRADNTAFEQFLPAIAAQSTDPRNFVKKAVSWALRQIGKRNRALNQRALAAAKAIAQLDSTAARWIAADALRELASPKVQQKFR